MQIHTDGKVGTNKGRKKRKVHMRKQENKNYANTQMKMER